MELGDRLPDPWNSIKIGKPDEPQLSIIIELAEPLYRGIRYNVIIRISDEKREITNAQVNGHIIEDKEQENE